MKLRAWQSECIELAMDHFYTKKHFLCLATPGAGKTTMAAELSKQLFNRGDIDFVLCFAPSLTVVSGLERTFALCLSRRFDGRIGAIGGAYTYQAMRSFGEQFWSLLESHRVLVVFDEIHHCSGNGQGGANAWGQDILTKIQHQAAYTLALTGTPWRSDHNPIVLAKYSDPEGMIQCDYTYGLRDAVRDGVCRKPGIVLIDNENFRLSGANDELVYKGLGELLQCPDVRYQHLLFNDKAIRFCLSLGCKQLDKLRISHANAGGLVVASSVSHAEHIGRILAKEYHKSVSVVTYMNKNAGGIIERFRRGRDEWIVSVGMISEGTDIPRLQVCCHLSRITTELYFRQVLGRVLRTTNSSTNEAWLYTFAEPMLVEYAERVAEEVPFDNTLQFKQPNQDYYIAEHKESEGYSSSILDPLNNLLDEHFNVKGFDLNNSPEDVGYGINITSSLECLGDFQQRIVDFFHTELNEK